MSGKQFSFYNHSDYQPQALIIYHCLYCLHELLKAMINLSINSSLLLSSINLEKTLCYDKEKIELVISDAIVTLRCFKTNGLSMEVVENFLSSFIDYFRELSSINQGLLNKVFYHAIQNPKNYVSWFDDQDWQSCETELDMVKTCKTYLYQPNIHQGKRSKINHSSSPKKDHQEEQRRRMMRIEYRDAQERGFPLLLPDLFAAHRIN